MANPLKALKKIAIGAAVAGAAGYVAGLLTAPKSGRETRKEFSKSANGGISDIEKQLKNLQDELGSLVSENKGRADDLNGKAQSEFHKLAEKANDSKDKVRNVLHSVHEGKASDKDLKKALSDAKHAIEHIKDFLRK